MKPKRPSKCHKTVVIFMNTSLYKYENISILSDVLFPYCILLLYLLSGGWHFVIAMSYFTRSSIVNNINAKYISSSLGPTMVCQEGVVTELDKLFYYRNHHLSKVEGKECIGYRSLQQHELVNPSL